MPQTQTQQAPTNQQIPEDPDQSYVAVDPQKQPLEFILQNKDAISRMPLKKQGKFIDLVWKRFALPRYQKAAGQVPLSMEEQDKLHLQFQARMLGIPFDPVMLDPVGKEKPGLVQKTGAALAGGGAGVLGGIRTMADLTAAVNKKLGITGKPIAAGAEYVSKKAGEAEGRAYEEAKAVSPQIASTSAAIGHQIPATIASAGAEGLLPKLAAGAPTALKAAAGGARGIVGGATYGAATPGGDPKSMAEWGGVLGAAFPLLARTFGIGGKGTTMASTEGAAGVEKAASVAPTVAGAAPKPTLESLKAEIDAQRAAKKAAAVAKKEAIAAKKAGTTGEQTAARQTKAQEAQATAQAQAQQRATTPTVNPTASAAVAENPQIKVSPNFPAGGGGINVAGTEKAMKENTPEQLAQALRVENDDLRARLREGKGSAEEKKIAEDRIKTNEGMIKEYDQQAKKTAFVTKVEEGKAGKKVRAKEGQPASPAQQKADRERMAQRRAEGKAPVANREITGGGVAESIAQHVEAQRAKFSVPTIGIQHIPEVEEAVKELEGGETILKEMQKYRRKGQINDEEYVHQLKEWMLDQFGKGE